MSHSKVSDITYTRLETQKYITSPLFTDEEVSLLFALRSKCVRECKANFRSMYSEVNCELCTDNKPDDQPHILQCTPLSDQLKSIELSMKKVEYSDIYSDPHKQKEVTVMISKLIDIKKKLIESKQKLEMDPSTLSDQVLKTSYNLHCTVNYSFGK